MQWQLDNLYVIHSNALLPNLVGLVESCANIVCERLLGKKWKLLSPGIPRQSQSIRCQRVRGLQLCRNTIAALLMNRQSWHWIGEQIPLCHLNQK
jgi:hypothetical protein